jgi:hypothetical protein
MQYIYFHYFWNKCIILYWHYLSQKTYKFSSWTMECLKKLRGGDSGNLNSVKKTLKKCLNLNSLPIIFREMLAAKCWEIYLMKLLFVSYFLTSLLLMCAVFLWSVSGKFPLFLWYVVTLHFKNVSYFKVDDTATLMPEIYGTIVTFCDQRY